jgi:chemotaxis protein MotB
MGFKKKPPEPEDPPGAPEWMLTFSDCMTLLLTFFVLLMTFSEIGKETIPALRNGFRKAMPGFKISDKMYRNTMASAIDTEPVDAVVEGSEAATLEEGTSGGLKQMAEFQNPYEPRIILIPSNKIFAGKAAALSPKGREILNVLGAYLKKIPNGVVIDEYSATKGETGLLRASAIVDYLTTKSELPRDRFGISNTKASNQQVLEDIRRQNNNDGVIEVVLLGQALR